MCVQAGQPDVGASPLLRGVQGQGVGSTGEGVGAEGCLALEFPHG